MFSAKVTILTDRHDMAEILLKVTINTITTTSL